MPAAAKSKLNALYKGRAPMILYAENASRHFIEMQYGTDQYVFGPFLSRCKVSGGANTAK
jgi:hypothetical protein